MAHILPSEVFDTCTDGFFICFGSWVSIVTQGLFWVFSLLGFCVALFLATVSLGGSRAYGYSSFVGMMGAIWLVVLGFISWWIASIFIIAGIIGIIILINMEK